MALLTYTGEAVPLSATGARKVDAALASKPTQARAAKPSASAAQFAEAEALIAEVDALPGPVHVHRVGDADVQRAIETTAAARMMAD